MFTGMRCIIVGDPAKNTRTITRGWRFHMLAIRLLSCNVYGLNQETVSIFLLFPCGTSRRWGACWWADSTSVSKRNQWKTWQAFKWHKMHATLHKFHECPFWGSIHRHDISGKWDLCATNLWLRVILCQQCTNFSICAFLSCGLHRNSSLPRFVDFAAQFNMI